MPDKIILTVEDRILRVKYQGQEIMKIKTVKSREHCRKQTVFSWQKTRKLEGALNPPLFSQ